MYLSKNNIVYAGWILSFGLLLLLKLHTQAEALERDILIHATVGNEFLHGRSFYTDLWDHKPPGTFLVHAFFIWLCGFNETYILLMNVLFNALSMFGVYLFSCMLSHNRINSLFACLFYALVSFDMDLQANQPNGEVLVNPFLLWGILIWYAVASRLIRRYWVLLAGFLLFLATLFKQQYIVIPFFVAIAFTFNTWFFQRREFRNNFRTLFWLVATAGAGWLFTLLIFWQSGSLSDFIDAAFKYNMQYHGSYSVLAKSGKFEKILPWFALGLAPYYLYSAIFIIFALNSKRMAQALFMSCWLLGCFISVWLPGQYFPHYYQVLIPPMLVATTVSISWLLSAESLCVVKPYFRSIAFLPVLMFSIARTSGFIIHDSKEWSELKYPDAHYAENKALGLSLSRFIKPDEQAFYMGRNPGIFLYAHLRAVNGAMFSRWFQEENSYSRSLLDREVDNFQRKDFDIAVFDIDFDTLGEPGKLLSVDLKSLYTEIPSCFSQSRIFVKNNSSNRDMLYRNFYSASVDTQLEMGLSLAECSSKQPSPLPVE